MATRPSKMNIIVLIVAIVAFILLTSGVFHPRWFKAHQSTTPQHLSLFDAIWCYRDVCYSFNDKPKSYFQEPGWLMAGRILGCFGMWTLIAGIIMYSLRFYRQFQNLHIVTTVMLVTSSLTSLITGFIFIDKFRQISSSWTVDDEDGLKLTYSTLPTGLIMFASVTTAIASIFSGLSDKFTVKKIKARLSQKK